MIVGILPAGGIANRIYKIPKFLLPTPTSTLLEHHVRMMEDAFVDTIVVPCRPELFTYLCGLKLSPKVHFAAMDTQTISEALLRVYCMYGQAKYMIGLPDVYLSHNPYQMLYGSLASGAECTVACWCVSEEQSHSLGMCLIDIDKIIDIDDKPRETTRRWAWGQLAWNDAFWKYVKREDAHLGIPLQAAIDNGMTVEAIKTIGDYRDCGTPDNYFDLTKDWTDEL